MAFADSQAKHPAAVWPDQPSHLRQRVNGADLLILTQRSFSSVEPLKGLRQGLSVSIIDIKDVYAASLRSK